MAAWVPSESLRLSGPGGCSPRRRLPAGASSWYRELRRRRRGRPGQQARHGVGHRCPACGVHPSGYLRLGSGCPTVRCPVARGRRPEGPALGRLLSTHPVSGVQLSGVHPCGVQPSGVCPRRSGRVRLLPCSGGGGGDPGRGGRATVTTGTGGGPGGWRAVDGSSDGRGGRDAGDVADVGLASRRWLAVRVARLVPGRGGRA